MEWKLEELERDERKRVKNAMVSEDLVGEVVEMGRGETEAME